MTRVVGKCGLCGGRVSVPSNWSGATPPEATCESCHAVAMSDEPTLPMLPRGNYEACRQQQHYISATEQLQRFGMRGNS